MGRLSLNTKSSPTPEQEVPPPYHDPRPSLIVTETTTTRTEVVTTTTETTTHLLSLSGWRKRDNINYTSPQHPRHSGNIEENGNSATTTPLIQRDKALPPTPSDPPTLPPVSLDIPSNRARTMSLREDIPHPTSFLAQASLGLGLPHVMPQMSSSSSPSASEVNTVAFISSSPAEPTSVIRRSKSSQRLTKSSAITAPEGEAGRRTRGLSLGPTSFLGFNVVDTKSKIDPPKALSRKASFWTRKKPQNPNSQARPSTAHGDVHSSMEVNLSELPPPNPRREKLQARDPLSRSSSERPHSYYPTINPEVSISLPSDCVVPTTRRPKTANSMNPTEQALLASHFTPGSGRTTAVSFSEANANLPPPRVRSQTSSPLLHRLSLNVFSSSTILATSPTASPTSSFLSAGYEPLRKAAITPRPIENGESPDVYVSRLMDAVSKVEVTSILASSAEPFYVMALKAFIGRFDFIGDPLDIALRKLLLEVGLPKETQQIDRVMEAFAKRYIQCNSSLYVSEDHPYILAFSLIMLHTDAFNKSNKHKMTKPDYIKNTRLPGVAPEILEYLYDNIVFAPFIFIEDPLDFNGQRGLVTETNRRSSAFRDLPSMASPHSSTVATLANKTNKIDPYYMISNDLLGPLRINVETHIPLWDPFSYEGTAGKWNEEELLLAFVNAHVVEVGSDITRSMPFFGLAPGGSSSPLIPTNSSVNDIHGELSALRVTKVGLMSRKDDLLEGGKKPMGRKWKSWGVVLTGSQLLFSRDPAWLNILTNRAETSDVQSLMPQSAVLKLDELLSVKNAIAVYDKSYTKHRFTFRLVLSDGRHLLLKALTEDDMNQWISRINYASAFKSAGVRMRLANMSGRSMQLTGVAAATSHLHDLQNQIYSPSIDSGKWDDDAPQELLEMLSGEGPVSKRRHVQRKVTLRTNREEVELEAPVPLEVQKTTEFKDTFDQVKADLAAASWTRIDKGPESALSLDIPTPMTSKVDLSPRAGSSLELSPQASSAGHPRLPSRSQIIEAKIAELDDRLTATESHLDTHMRFVRNVATLTPFQKATRDRLVVAIQARARTVMQLRLDIARMRCHRNVLRDDMLAETRIWREVKDIALQTAKETLESRQRPEVPQMTLSMYGTREESPGMALHIQRRQKSESSICESFHTAIDFGPDWPSSDDLGSSLLAASRMFDSPRPSTSESISSYLYPEYDGKASTTRSQAAHDASSEGEETNAQHEKFYTAQESLVEEAEAWDKTRCAKRVSLVRVPSNLELLPVSKRLTRSLSTTAEA